MSEYPVCHVRLAHNLIRSNDKILRCQSGTPETVPAPKGCAECPQRLQDARLWPGAPPTCPSQDARQWRPEGAPRTRLPSAQPIDAAYEVDEAKDTRNSPL